MWKGLSKKKNLKVGDLVYHLLHGREWVGIILEIIEKKEDDEKRNSHREFAKVTMQPGTKYESFFKKMLFKKNKINDTTGLVSTSWLFLLEDTDRKKK